MSFLKKLISSAFLKTILPSKGDWKTKLGSILLMIAMLLKTIPVLFTMQHEIGDLLIAIGTGLGGVGIADKLNKLTPKAK